MNDLKRNTSAVTGAPSAGYRSGQFEHMDPPRKPGRPTDPTRIHIGKVQITIPIPLWIQIGSPLFVVKDHHLPSGEVHIIPASSADLHARQVGVEAKGARRTFRLRMSPRDQRLLKPGAYPAHLQEVLGRLVIIIKGALR